VRLPGALMTCAYSWIRASPGDVIWLRQAAGHKAKRGETQEQKSNARAQGLTAITAKAPLQAQCLLSCSGEKSA